MVHRSERGTSPHQPGRNCQARVPPLAEKQWRPRDPNAPRLAARPDPPVGAGDDARGSGNLAIVVDITATLIATAARDAFGRVGLRQRGRSQCWSDDHGWWLINVEFQPS